MREEKSNNNTSSILLLLFVVILFVTSITSSMIVKYVDNWFKGPVIFFIHVGVQLLRVVSFILPALAIKNKTYRVIGVIALSIMTLYMVYGLIQSIALYIANHLN